MAGPVPPASIRRSGVVHDAGNGLRVAALQSPEPTAADELRESLWNGYTFALERFKEGPTPKTWRDLCRAYEAWQVAFNTEPDR